jgi:hypothetical protein
MPSSVLLSHLEAVAPLPLREVWLEQLSVHDVVPVHELLRRARTTARVTGTIQLSSDAIIAPVRLDHELIELAIAEEHRARIAGALWLPVDSPRLRFT